MNLKMLVAYHKDAPVVQNELFVPIHLGHGSDYEILCQKMIGDDTGANISDKNATYNELTAIYWAWKHYDELGDPDKIGFCHYRRFFIFEKRKQAYFETTAADVEKQLLLDRVNLVQNYDFVAPVPNKRTSVYDNYKKAHHKDDFALLLDIIAKDYPAFWGAAKTYASGQKTFFYNMFIFGKEDFFAYCRFVFGVLEQYVERTQHKGERLFVSEVLTGIFFTWLLQKGRNVLYLPVLFVATKQTRREAWAETKSNLREKKTGLLYAFRPVLIRLIPKSILLRRKQKSGLKKNENK